MSTDRPTLIITGGTGLIGRAVVRCMADRFRVFSFDRDDDEGLPPGAEFIDVDLTREAEIQRGLERVREAAGRHIASVLHFAAYYDFSGEPSPLYEEVTVQGTARLLKALRQFEVEQFVFSSTMLVHAPCEPGERITEESPIRPTWAYPESKVKTEELLRTQHGDIPIVSLRIAGVYDEMCHSIPLSHQIQRIYEEHLTSHVYPGDTDRGQAFIHRDDLVSAISHTVSRRAELPTELSLLLGEPTTYSYGAIQEELGRLIHGEKWETYWVPKFLAKAGAWVQEQLPFGESPFIKPWMVDRADDHYALDISAAQNHLGWTPKHSLWATLPEIVERLRADPQRWYRENGLEPPT